MSQDLIAAGWSYVVRLLAAIEMLHGGVRGVAGLVMLSRSVRRALLVWLRPAEALARRLLLLRAAALGPENAPGRLGRWSARFKPWRGRGGYAHDDPARWPVRFALQRPAARATSRKRRPAAPARFTAALPLAERIEALIRVAADPERYARRLARRLARADRALRIPPHRPREVWPLTPSLLGAVDALLASAVPADTS